MGENEIEIVVDVDDKATDKLGNIGQAAGKIGGMAAAAVSKFAGMLMSAASGAGEFAGKMAMGAASTGAMAAGTTAATGGMNVLVGALLAAAAAVPALIAGFAALAPMLSMVGGLAGAATTGLFGAGIAAATLGVGLGGVSEAWSAYGKSAGGGGGASKASGEAAYQAARRVEQAEEALSRAKRSAKEASLEVNKARESERERIEDLTLALRAQKYAQEDATEALTSAEDKLKREQVYGNSNSVAAAQKEVDRAKYRYDYETERLDDLKQEKSAADKAGINGSDQVKDALQRERDAAESVTAAQEALADSKRKTEIASAGAAGGVNAFADAMNKLSPNAQKFVRTLIELKERFEGVKRAVQDRLFAGLDETLRDLAEKWGPHLVPILGNMADAFNRMAKGIAEGLGDSAFIQNIAEIGESFGTFVEYLGEALTSLLDAFARIGAAAGPILEKIGEFISNVAEKFAEWIRAADESGALETFMQNAANYLGQIKDIGATAFAIMVEFIKILFPGSESAGGGILESVQNGLDSIKEWLGEPENQERIKEMIKQFGEFFKKLVTKWIPDLIQFGQDFGALVKPIAKVINALSDVKDWLTNTLPNAIKSMSNKGGNIFNGVKDGFREAVNWIIGKWNNLSFSLPSVNFLGNEIGGGSISTPNISYLATGGIAGNGRAVMNERGAEAVKLPTGSMVYSAGDSARMMGGGGGGTDINVRVVRTTERGIVDAVMGMLRFEVATQYGGDVQLALGENR